jgi:hypothetical protein
LHEAGHAFIADQNIPVLGKEDAVDHFATILLLNYVDSGDDIAISAADMFTFESEDRKEFCEFQFDSLSQSWDHYFKQTN